MHREVKQNAKVITDGVCSKVNDHSQRVDRRVGRKNAMLEPRDLVVSAFGALPVIRPAYVLSIKGMHAAKGQVAGKD